MFGQPVARVAQPFGVLREIAYDAARTRFARSVAYIDSVACR